MGQFISGARTNQNLYKEDTTIKQQQKRPIIKQIEYFPHNDTLHTLYLCPHQDSTQLRIRSCVFSNNVGNRFHIFHSYTNLVKKKDAKGSILKDLTLQFIYLECTY